MEAENWVDADELNCKRVSLMVFNTFSQKFLFNFGTEKSLDVNFGKNCFSNNLCHIILVGLIGGQCIFAPILYFLSFR